VLSVPKLNGIFESSSLSLASLNYPVGLSETTLLSFSLLNTYTFVSNSAIISFSPLPLSIDPELSFINID